MRFFGNDVDIINEKIAMMMQENPEDAIDTARSAASIAKYIKGDDRKAAEQNIANASMVLAVRFSASPRITEHGFERIPGELLHLVKELSPEARLAPIATICLSAMAKNPAISDKNIVYLADLALATAQDDDNKRETSHAILAIAEAVPERAITLCNSVEQSTMNLPDMSKLIQGTALSAAQKVADPTQSSRLLAYAAYCETLVGEVAKTALNLAQKSGTTDVNGTLQFLTVLNLLDYDTISGALNSEVVQLAVDCAKAQPSLAERLLMTASLYANKDAQQNDIVTAAIRQVPPEHTTLKLLQLAKNDLTKTEDTDGLALLVNHALAYVEYIAPMDAKKADEALELIGTVIQMPVGFGILSDTLTISSLSWDDQKQESRLFISNEKETGLYHGNLRLMFNALGEQANKLKTTELGLTEAFAVTLQHYDPANAFVEPLLTLAKHKKSALQND